MSNRKYIEDQTRKPITLAMAKALTPGAIILHRGVTNADGSPLRFKVTSVQTWVRTPARVEVHLKQGLYFNCVITQDDLDRFFVWEPIQ
jgi:hypothetical protein